LIIKSPENKMSESVFDLLEKIKTKISDEEFQTLFNIFQKVSEKAQEEDESFIQNNFITCYTLHKQNAKAKKAQKKGCQCGPNEICLASNVNTLKNCKNYDEFMEINPMLWLMYGRNLRISFGTEMDLGSDLIPLRYNLMNLINLAELFSGKDQLLLILSIFHFSVKNIYLLIMDKTAAFTVNEIMKNYLLDSSFVNFLKHIDVNPEFFKESIEITLVD